MAASETEKLVRDGKDDITASPEGIDLKFTALEKALAEALESIQTLEPAAEGGMLQGFADPAVPLPAELARETARRLREAMDMGDVTELNRIAEDVKSQSDSYAPLAEKITGLAEDFDFEGILELTKLLDP